MKGDRDPIWDVLEELFGRVRTVSERGRRNRAVKELKEADATIDEIRATFAYCQREFTHFGEMAICAHLGTAQAPSPRIVTVADVWKLNAAGDGWVRT